MRLIQLVILALYLVLAPLVAEAQEPGRTPQVGWSLGP